MNTIIQDWKELNNHANLWGCKNLIMPKRSDSLSFLIGQLYTIIIDSFEQSLNNIKLSFFRLDKMCSPWKTFRVLTKEMSADIREIQGWLILAFKLHSKTILDVELSIFPIEPTIHSTHNFCINSFIACG